MNTAGYDVVDQLLLKQKVMEEKKKDKAQKIIEAREYDEAATFKPVTLNYENRGVQPTHGDRCLDLYSRVRPG